MEIEIQVRTKSWWQGDKGLRFNAWLGNRLLCTSETPFFDAARILLQEGHSPDDDLVMIRENGVVSLKARIGYAASRTVKEGDRAPRIARHIPYPKNALASVPGRVLRHSEEEQ